MNVTDAAAQFASLVEGNEYAPIFHQRAGGDFRKTRRNTREIRLNGMPRNLQQSLLIILIELEHDDQEPALAASSLRG